MKQLNDYLSKLWLYCLMVLCAISISFFTSCSDDDSPLEDEKTEEEIGDNNHDEPTDDKGGEVGENEDARFPGLDLSKCYVLEIDGKKEYQIPSEISDMYVKSANYLYILEKYNPIGYPTAQFNVIEFVFHDKPTICRKGENAANIHTKIINNDFFDTMTFNYVSGQAIIYDFNKEENYVLIEFKDLVMRNDETGETHTIDGISYHNFDFSVWRE